MLRQTKHSISVSRILRAAPLILAFLTGGAVSFAADDLNLSETTLQPQRELIQMNVEDYQSIIDSFSKGVDDAELRQLLDRLNAQLENGDAEGASITREEIRSYIESNSELAPYGLNELLMSSLFGSIKDADKVDVNVKSLSEAIQPIDDLGEDAAERAAKMQELASLLSEANPGLAAKMMDMANLINLGRDEDARSIYHGINRDLFNAFLQLDPELVSKAFDYLGVSIGETGGVTLPAEFPDASSPSDLLPDVGSLALPVAGAPVSLGVIPAVNLTSPSVFLYAIVIPLLVIPLFAFERRLKVYVPRAASSVMRRVRSVEEQEPSEPNERVFYHFRRLVQIMGARGVVKPDYETHREFVKRCSGRAEEASVKKVSDMYEVARFTGFGVSEKEADLCARLVDSVENVSV